MTSLVDFVFRKSPSWKGNSGLKSIRYLFKQVVHLLDLFCGHCLDDEHLVSTREQSNEVQAVTPIYVYVMCTICSVHNCKQCTICRIFTISNCAAQLVHNLYRQVLGTEGSCWLLTSDTVQLHSSQGCALAVSELKISQNYKIKSRLPWEPWSKS